MKTLCILFLVLTACSDRDDSPEPCPVVKACVCAAYGMACHVQGPERCYTSEEIKWCAL